jgi:hypothetical protein
MTLLAALTLFALVVVIITAIIGYRYNPFRKYVMRLLDPTWQKRARIYSFSPAEEKQEEDNMYVSSTVMRDGCDLIWDEFENEPPREFFEYLRRGTVVFVNTMHVERFIAEVLPKMQGEFVLVTARENNSTANFDADTLLGSGKILHWFIENFELSQRHLETGLITLLPLGLNYHKLDPQSQNQSRDMGLPSGPGNQQLTMKAICEQIAPIRERPLKIYSNFHLNMDIFLRHHHAQKRHIARGEAQRALSKMDFMIWEPRQAPRNDVWLRHREAVFEASPRGNSIDCHRAWEALFLRSIPIVKTSSLDPMYEGLPVVIVKEWDEITLEAMQGWLDQYADWFDRPLPEQLFSNYWIARFHAFKEQN